MYPPLKTRFTEAAGVQYPIIGGAMYPCSNPELIAAVSEAGGLGIIQPISLTYVHGYEFHEGLKKIRSLTKKPVGLNVLLEVSSKVYEERMRRYIRLALEEGVRFFVTALGKPRWVVDLVKPFGGIVYHDVTLRKWAEKAVDSGVDGLICVNSLAGGHAGVLTPEQLLKELEGIDLPKICAGGVGDAKCFHAMLNLGYDGVQLGTRLIATVECSETSTYKNAIVQAQAKDITLTERVTGIPLSVIRTPYLEKIGTKASCFSRFLLKNRYTKKWMRLWYALHAISRFKQINLKGPSTRDFWQAGKSVEGIHSIEPVAKIIQNYMQNIP